MRLTSFSSLLLNYYFINDILDCISLYNNSYFVLSLLKEKREVCYLGYSDNVIKDMLDVNYISNEVDYNNKIFTNNKRIGEICPYCNRNQNKELSLNYDLIKNNISEDDVIIYDTLDNEMLELSNESYLILDSNESISSYSLYEIREKIDNKFKCIILSSSVINYIKDKFKIDACDLYDMIHTNLLIIFNYKYGATFIYNNNEIYKEIEDAVEEIDRVGGISAFASVFIDYLIDNEELNEKIISKLFLSATMMYRKVVNKIGFNKKFYIKEYDECICNKFMIKK